MHEDELAIDADLVRRLLADQMPSLARLAVREVGRGTVNAMFRLGDDLAVRLPRTAAWVADVEREREWLPRLQSRLSLAIPEPVAYGGPGDGYPLPWAVYGWIDGLPYDDHTVTAELAAADELARFVSYLRDVEVASDAPLTGRRPLAELDASTRTAVAHAGDLLDGPAVVAAWERALEAPPFDGERVWVHTDLLRPNLLVRGGRLAAVLDFGAVGVGDPAADVIAAWTVFGPTGRKAYRELLEVDDAAWERARGYALTQAALIVPYYRETNPAFAESALRTLREIVADAN